MKLNLSLKTVLIEMILALDLIENLNNMKRSCLELAYRILTCTLTLRQWITQINVFQLLLGFFKFWAASFGFVMLGLKSSNSVLNC